MVQNVYMKNFEQDVIKLISNEKEELKITFIKHGSFVIEYNGIFIYNDPVMDYANFNVLPKADFIIISHEHSDHFDSLAVEALKKEDTKIISNKTVIDSLNEGIALSNQEYCSLTDKIRLKAVAAYNTTIGRTHYHPRGRDNGYVLDIDGTIIYISGDTEYIPEMRILTNLIDIAFLSVNQPYTMTVEQATNAAIIINPKILYPYHYGETNIKTHLEVLKENLKEYDIDLRVRQMQ